MKNVFLVGLASLLLAACGATGTKFSSMTEPAEGQSKLYVYRTSAFKGNGVHYNVYANDKLIGNIRSGGYLSTELAPGDYEIWGKTEVRRSVKVPLRPNEIQCVKASVGFGFFVGHPKFELVPLDKCKAEITQTVASH
ncbi:MAG: DUF2846 domain-containing protein [Neisseria sp.]|uniref:DUF2846 domain-containing protein n=1 Tax=Neisseria sp. TaxID=192066 RepID=UPI0026DAC01A|nr:DUF2846 domain-containing protein [Neisseria sp.]MDO4640919.1 DUF2846 domain-containing protein [Neisseria sp.]